MGPRIEYENPLAVGRPDKIAAGDKVRRENRRRKSNSDQKKPGKRRDEDQVGEGVEVGDSDAPQDLGKRIDFEA